MLVYMCTCHNQYEVRGQPVAASFLLSPFGSQRLTYQVYQQVFLSME